MAKWKKWCGHFCKWFIDHAVWRFTGDRLLDKLVGVLVSGSVASALSWLINPLFHSHMMPTVIAGIVVFVGIMVIWQRVASHTKPYLDVELTPSSGPRSDVLLTVKNKGGSRNFYAQCTLLALRNSPNVMRSGTFDLMWEHTLDKCVPIGTGASNNLLIATFNDDHKNALATMELWGLSGNAKKQCEWSRWNLDSREKVPEYDLEISIFSDGARGPFSERFTLTAESWHGSPKMTRMNQ